VSRAVFGEAGRYLSDFRQPPVPQGWQGEGVSERSGAAAPGLHAASGGLRVDSPFLALAEDLLVRRAGSRPGDRAALEAMFLRCSPSTVYRRFHGQVKAFPASYLAEALSGVPEHYALVACAGPAGAAGAFGGAAGLAGERVVALASCRLDPDHGEAELGILVEDAWQRRGLGSSLLGQLVSWAGDRGVRVLNAQVLTEHDWIIGLLAPYGHCSSVFRRGVREVRVDLTRT
jgi:GNAT superfamily N-acetyltransferase